MNLSTLPNSSFCNTGCIVFHKKVVWTGGPSTCFVLFVKTRNALLCWHFASVDAFDSEKMNYVRRQLETLSIRGSSFYLLPGADRDPTTWDLKPESRTVGINPGIDPTASRVFFMNFMRQFRWFGMIVLMEPAKDYREFVVLLKNADKPVFVKDDTFFNKTCLVDAEKMV